MLIETQVGGEPTEITGLREFKSSRKGSPSTEGSLTKRECLQILDLYRGWNIGQTSNNPKERDLLDARRQLIIEATNKLRDLI